MAKYDDARVRNMIDYENKRATGLIGNLREGAINPQFSRLFNLSQLAQDRDMETYGNLQSGFNEFAKTGGFSPSDISAIRSRAVSPVRAAYANAGREVDRARALQGGSLPGYAALKARMAREMGQAGADATTNAEAAIAQLVQQGKLAGLSGGTNLYGTTPAQSALFGNQALGASGQAINLAGLDLDRALGFTREKTNAAQLPGKFQSAVGNISSGLGLIGQIGGAISPWMQASKAVLPSKNIAMVPSQAPTTGGSQDVSRLVPRG